MFSLKKVRVSVTGGKAPNRLAFYEKYGFEELFSIVDEISERMFVFESMHRKIFNDQMYKAKQLNDEEKNKWYLETVESLNEVNSSLGSVLKKFEDNMKN